MALKLTQRQKEILKFMAYFEKINHMPPTIREIAKHFGFSSHMAAANHLNALNKKGYKV